MSMIDREKLIEAHEFFRKLQVERTTVLAMYNTTGSYEYKFRMQGLDDAIDILLDQPAAEQWIPVVERLPERNDFYDVTFELDCGVRLCQREYFDIEDNRWLTPYNVIAWKERPEPYKGVE